MIDLLFLKGPGIDRPYTVRMYESRIVIGRRWGSSNSSAPDVDLQMDPLVSRRHVCLNCSEERLSIEDLDASNGTQVDMQEIAQSGPVGIRPGMLIRTGDTLWTVIPPYWQFIYNKNVLVCFLILPEIAYACIHCGIKILRDVRAGNFGNERSAYVRFSLEIPDFSDRLTLDLPPIDPFSSMNIQTLPLQFNYGTLRKQTEPVHSVLRIRLLASETVDKKGDVTVLGFNAWPYTQEAVKTLAGFIFPRDRCVETIAFTVNEFIRKRENSSLSNGPDVSCEVRPEKKKVDAIYEFLAEQSRVTYVPPSLSHASKNSGFLHQVLQLPSSLFLFEDPVLKGQGTCIDLALLFAACFERCGILPLVILTGRAPFKPEHAFAGYRAGATPGPIPVITDRQVLLKDIQQGTAGILESTGIAEGYAAAGKLTLAEACAEAARIFSKSPWVCILDIGALRPPEGTITPMGYTDDPDVLRIYNETENFTRLKRRRSIETRFLLYGVLIARGPILQVLEKEFHAQFSLIVTEMEKNISTKEYNGPLIRTETYNECMLLAERYAWQAGSAVVREQDVLWALIEKGKANINIRRIFQHAGFDIAILADALHKLHPRPVMFQSSVFSGF